MAQRARAVSFTPPGDMKCAVCGWWPPLVRVRRGRTKRASDAWRWRRLREHLGEACGDEHYDGNADGPHNRLMDRLP